MTDKVQLLSVKHSGYNDSYKAVFFYKCQYITVYFFLSEKKIPGRLIPNNPLKREKLHSLAKDAFKKYLKEIDNANFDDSETTYV